MDITESKTSAFLLRLAGCRANYWLLLAIFCSATSSTVVGAVQTPIFNTAAQQHPAAFKSLNDIPRGGGIGDAVYSHHHPLKGIFDLVFNRKKSPSQYYRESLEEQVLLLDRQLRQAREEIANLREERSTSVKASRSSSNRTRKKVSSSSTTSTRSPMTDQRISTLSKQIKQLEQMKAELENMLNVSSARVEELEEKLLHQEKLTQELVQNYEAQLASLRASMEETARNQLEKVEQLMEERVAQAEEAARIAERAKLEETISQMTEELQRQHSAALEAERKRSAQAVEQEKKKMRKLVKALAIREKKLAAKAAREKQKEQYQLPAESGGPVNVRTQANKPKSTPTTRGPI